MSNPSASDTNTSGNEAVKSSLPGAGQEQKNRPPLQRQNARRSKQDIDRQIGGNLYQKQALRELLQQKTFAGKKEQDTRPFFTSSANLLQPVGLNRPVGFFTGGFIGRFLLALLLRFRLFAFHPFLTL